MKAIIQRVTDAAVSVEGKVVGSIGQGLVIFIGIEINDAPEDASYLAKKITNTRIFPSDARNFSLSALDTKSDILVISQFTLLGDTRKGRRPSFTDAASPKKAYELYNFFIQEVRNTGLKVETGIFQKYMMVEIHNDGPVTLLIESPSQKI
jgi:D-tyrosyl-tRNA(Tyr) deacylase